MNSKSRKRQVKTGKASGLWLRRPIIKKLSTILVIIVVGLGVFELGRLSGLWGDPNTLRAVKSEKISSKKLAGHAVSTERCQRAKNSYLRKRLPHRSRIVSAQLMVI